MPRKSSAATRTFSSMLLCANMRLGIENLLEVPWLSPRLQESAAATIPHGTCCLGLNENWDQKLESENDVLYRAPFLWGDTGRLHSMSWGSNSQLLSAVICGF